MKKRLAVIALIFLAAGIAGARADEPQYMAMFMGDVKIGHARAQRTVADGEVTHQEDMVITLNRGAMEITVRVESRSVETADGQPLRFSYSALLGALGAMKKEGVIKDGKIHVTSEQMGAKQTQVIPYPTGALMTEGATLLQKKKGLAPGTSYSFVAFDPDSLKGLRHDCLIGKPTDVPLIGKVARLVPVEMTIHHSQQTIKMTSYTDESFNIRKAEMSMLGIKIRLVGCDEKYARSPNGKFDLTRAATVASPVAIDRPRKLRKATYTLVPIDKTSKLILPVTDSQTVQAGPDGSLLVRVATVDSAKGARPYRGDAPAALAALKATQYVQSADPKLIKKAMSIVGDDGGALSAAKAIAKAVGEHITKKDLSVGYASALETLQSARGDCTEHAVLTAALCRAVGIPCRIVVGVAYADQFGDQRQCFAGHAWNQVYVGAKWVDLDASLVEADAARITLAVGTDEPTGFIGMLNSLGNFKITRIQLP